MEPLIVLVVILAVALGVMFYSLFLQKAATTRQAKNMQSVQESIEQQKEGIRLQRENNDLLREIVEALKGRKDA
jgi:cell division protein FtsL